VIGDGVVTGFITRADGDIDAWLRPVYSVPFDGTAGDGTIDQVLIGISEAFTASYCLEAYTGRHLANRTEKIDELRSWAVKRLEMIVERPEMLDSTQHPLRSVYDSQTKNQIMFWRQSNRSTIDVNKPAEEWSYPTKDEDSL
tara:strand:+ start:231 stop:656 length:426 start_codon:yes stop_codon:yes gene_type:complete